MLTVNQFGEALLLNEDCFLGELEWQSLLKTMASTKNSKYSSVAVDLWSSQVRLTRMLRQTGEIVLSTGTNAVIVDLLTCQLQHFRRQIFQWRDANDERANACEPTDHNVPENICLSFAGQIFANRAIIALNPFCADATRFEAETKVIADLVVGIANVSKQTNMRGDLLLTRVLHAAKMALASHDDYVQVAQGHEDYINKKRNMVSPSVWERFMNGMMGRKLTPGLIKREDVLSELDFPGSWLVMKSQNVGWFDGGYYCKNGQIRSTPRKLPTNDGTFSVVPDLFSPDAQTASGREAALTFNLANETDASASPASTAGSGASANYLD